jgi:hypothetical protein
MQEPLKVYEPQPNDLNSKGTSRISNQAIIETHANVGSNETALFDSALFAWGSNFNG